MANESGEINKETTRTSENNKEGIMDKDTMDLKDQKITADKTDKKK